MTRIEFRTHIADKVHYACRLVRKALSSAPNSKIVLYATHQPLLEKLDDALWTFSDNAFLPHTMAGTPQAAHSPIILANAQISELPYSDILINLSSDIPTHYAQFERLIELVSQDPHDAEAGRQRDKHYRERGYELHHTSTA